MIPPMLVFESVNVSNPSAEQDYVGDSKFIGENSACQVLNAISAPLFISSSLSSKRVQSLVNEDRVIFYKIV